MLKKKRRASDPHLSYDEYRTSMKGQGLTRKQMSEGYAQHKEEHGGKKLGVWHQHVHEMGGQGYSRSKIQASYDPSKKTRNLYNRNGEYEYGD